MRSVRLFALLLALVLLAAACAVTGDPAAPEPGETEPAAPVQGPQEPPGDGDPAPVPGDPSGGEDSPGEGSPPADAPPADAPPADGPPAAAPPASSPSGTLTAGGSDLGGIGAMCRDYLRPSAPRLLVEIQHQAGARPTQGAIDHLVAVLGSVVDKPAGVTVTVEEVPGGARTWSSADLRDFASQHRRHYSNADTSVLYVLSPRGEFVEREGIGVAHRASEFAIFPDRIDTLSALLGGRSAVERAVMVHEAGHLLCLVNIGYRSDIDHEDPEHPNHSNDRRSVMFWAIETSAVAQLFTGPPPNDFTANDRADLDGLRTGRY